MTHTMADARAEPIARAGGGAKSSSATDRLVSIGQLVRELQSEFPGLSISKVRYLEDRGLITPQRTKGKYRKYSKADARRLRGILAMQRDEYLPLEVIKRRVETGAASDPGGAKGLLEQEAAPLEMSLVREEATYTLEEFRQALGADEEFVLSLVEFRLVDRRSEDEPAFTEGDLLTARVCQRLGHYRVEPRHLRMLSSAAEREAGLIEQIATPALRSGHADKKEYGLETVQELASLFARLTQLLLRRELRRSI